MKAIITTYHGPAERRGSRIIASDSDNNRVVLSYDPAISSDDNHDAAARALCVKKGWIEHDLVRGEIRIGGKLRYVYTFLHPRDRVTVNGPEATR